MQKYIKEIISALAIAIITGAFTKINFLEKEVYSLKQQASTVNADIKKLNDSRDNLSKYYVTRIEHNTNVKNQESRFDSMDKKLDKITDLLLLRK